jgi:hypothetical protein
MDITTEQLLAATQRMERMQAKHATVAAVYYHAETDRLLIQLANGLDLSFSPKLAQELQHATASDLAEVDITASGLAVYFPRIDASLYIPGLLAGMFGTKQWMQSEFARRGGQATSEAKALAARTNGKLGGRPRKNKTVA